MDGRCNGARGQKFTCPDKRVGVTVVLLSRGTRTVFVRSKGRWSSLKRARSTEHLRCVLGRLQISADQREIHKVSDPDGKGNDAEHRCAPGIRLVLNLRDQAQRHQKP